MNEKHIKGWHFCKDWKLRDGQPVVVGKTYHVDGDAVMCERGLHLSERIIDALQYAPGGVICRVEGWGDVQRDTDKLVCRNRTVLSAIDAERILHLAACKWAEDALRIAGVTDKRCWDAVHVKRLWLDGKAADEELRIARDAANATRNAAWAAFRSAASAKQNRYLTRVVVAAMAEEVR